jgi:hypothetical protein
VLLLWLAALFCSARHAAADPVGPWPVDLEVPYYVHPLPSSDSPILAAGDFNQDGFVDLYEYSNSNPGGSGFLLGKGNGTFYRDTDAPSSPTGPVAFVCRGIATADFDGDGKVDLAGFGPYSDVRVYSWPSSQPIMGMMTQGSPQQTAAADLDRDGWVDFVYATAGGSVYWLRNQGGTYLSGAFPIMQNALSGAPAFLQVADLDNDGYLDVLLLQGSSSYVALATAPGVFSGPPVVNQLDGAVKEGTCALGDWTDDGLPDLVYGETTHNKLVFAENYGGVYFPRRYDAGLIHDQQGGAGTLVAGDFQSAPGLEFCQVVDQSIVVYRVDTIANGIAIATGLGTALAGDLIAMDFNGDGKLDLASGTYGRISVFLGNGDGTFGQGKIMDLNPPGPGFPVNPVCVAVDDLDRDGVSEMIVGGADGVGKVVRGASVDPWTFSTAVPYTFGFPGSSSAGSAFMRTARLNGDLFPDLVCSRGGTVSVLLGTGTGTFAPLTTVTTSASPWVESEVGDVNGDGKTDIVVNLMTSLKVYLGDGLGGFTPGNTFSLPFGDALSVAVGQIGGSAAAEIVVGIGSAIFVVWDNGGRLETIDLPNIGSYPATLVDLADLDLDGDLDVIVAGPNSASPGGVVVALDANGGSSLSQSYQASIPVTPTKMVAGSLYDTRSEAQVVLVGQDNQDDRMVVLYPTSAEAQMDFPQVGVGFAILDLAIDRSESCEGLAMIRSIYPGQSVAVALSTLATTLSTDVEPVIESPPIAAVEAGSVLSFKATVRDFERDPIASFTAGFGNLPPGNTASFSLADSVGTITWAVPDTVPAGGTSPIGIWPVTMTANFGTRSRTTWVDVLPTGVSTMATFTWVTSSFDAGTYNVQFQAKQGATTVLTTVTIVVQAPGGPAPAPALPHGAGAVTEATNAITLYAPAAVTVTAGERVAFVVSSAGASELKADLTPLPTGADVSFAVNHEPWITAPVTAIATPGVPVSITVNAGDNDGDPIALLDAILPAFPTGTAAAFVPTAGNGSGTLTVTLPPGASGNYGITFRARNSLMGRAGTVLQVTGAQALPRAYWKFNGSPADERGVANLFYSGPYGAGALGQGLAPQNSPASIGQTLASLAVGPGPFTIEFWVRTSGPLAWPSTALQAADFSGTNRWGFEVGAYDGGEGGHARFFFASATLPYTTIESTSDVSDGAFHHVAVTYHDPTLVIYVDGVLERSESSHAGLAVPWNGGAFTVGTGDGFQLAFPGVIDELRLWDLARTGAELAGWMGKELTTTVTAVESEPSPRYVNRLGANTPNPFNPATTIPFELGAPGHVRLQIFDVRGRLVRTLLDGVAPAGPARARWAGEDAQGRDLGSGVYFAVLEAPGFRQSRRLVLLK